LDLGAIAVLVPVKALGEAKSRMAPLLTAQERRELALAMLRDVLAAVRAVHAGPLLLVSPSDACDGVARAFGAGRVEDRGTGYNRGVALALASEQVRVAPAAVVLPADQARALPSDLARLLDALRDADVALVPSADGGTGALGLRPPSAIKPAFGPASAAAHRRLAEAAGLRLALPDCPSLRHDIDDLDDLIDECGYPPGVATAAFVEQYRARVGSC
jgi:2-phospho-L-lactate guanylyltransferase